jgi:YihY family inner membrane protein
VPVAVWKKFRDDQAGNLAALIAGYAFIAIFPLLLVLVTVLDIVFKNNHVLRQRLEDSALAQYPVIGPQLAHNIGPLRQTGLALVIALLSTLFGARGVAMAAQNALNSVWEIPIARRPVFPWLWVRGFVLILVPGLGLLGTTTLSIMASGAGGVLTGFGVHAAVFAASLVLNVGLFWLAFRLATASEISWRQLWLGAVISAVIWQVLQAVGGYLVAHQLARASPSYGTFAIMLGLIFWLYLEADLALSRSKLTWYGHTGCGRAASRRPIRSRTSVRTSCTRKWRSGHRRAEPRRRRLPGGRLAWGKGANFRRGELAAVDPASRTVKLTTGLEFDCDYLILATGVSVSYYGIKGAAGHVPATTRSASCRARTRTRSGQTSSVDWLRDEGIEGASAPYWPIVPHRADRRATIVAAIGEFARRSSKEA